MDANETGGRPTEASRRFAAARRLIRPTQPLHPVAAITMLAAAVVTLVSLYGKLQNEERRWSEPYWPVWSKEMHAVVIAILVAGGVGLLSRTVVGLWLGRAGAVVLVLGALQWATWIPGEAEGLSLGFSLYLFYVPICAVMGIAGIGILWALQPRRVVHAGDASGPERPGP